MSGPEGRNEVGEGKILDGAVGGDMPEEDKPILADVTEGSDGVDVCRMLPEWRISVGPRSTRYDKGGGGAKGRSSSFPTAFCNRSRVLAASLFPEPVTMRQILASPPFFFFVLPSL